MQIYPEQYETAKQGIKNKTGALALLSHINIFHLGLLKDNECGYERHVCLLVSGSPPVSRFSVNVRVNG